MKNLRILLLLAITIINAQHLERVDKELQQEILFLSDQATSQNSHLNKSTNEVKYFVGVNHWAREVIFWDINTLEEIKRISVFPETNAPYAVLKLKENNLIAVSGHEMVYIINIKTGEILQKFNEKFRTYYYLHSLDEPNLFMTSDSFGKVNIRNYKTGEEVRQIVGYENHHTYYPIIYLRNYGLLVTTYLKDIEVKKFKTGEIVNTFSHHQSLMVLLHLEGSLIASAGHDGKTSSVKIFDVFTGTVIKTFTSDQTGKTHKIISSLLALDNRRLIAAGSIDGFIRIWNVETEELVIKFYTDSIGIPAMISLGNDSDLIAISAHEFVKIYNYKTGEHIKTIYKGEAGHIKSFILY